MASTSEKGYHINAAHLQQLIQYAQSLGAAYQPSQPYLSLVALQNLHDQVVQSLADVQAASAQLINAVNERQSAFAPIKKLVTRIINALDASGVDAAIIKDARTIVNKITRANPKKEMAPNQDGDVSPKSISTSRQSYASYVENLSMLLAIVANTPTYLPNEPSLQTTSIQAYIDTLHTANNNVYAALSQLSNKRYTRDALQFMPKTGLVDVSLDFKKYIKSVYGGYSHQYQTIGNLYFTRYKFVPSATGT